MLRKQMATLVDIWNRYERHLSVGTMVIGFTFDLLIAKRPDSLFDNLLLLTYLLASASAIVLVNIHIRRSTPGEKAQPIFLLLIMQFCFGGLSSNLLILYGKSGTQSGDILFLALLVGMLVGNEFLKDKYNQSRFNLAVYYLLLLTYCTIAVPTFLLHSIGLREFLVSGAVSLAVMAAFLFLLSSSTGLFRGRAGKRLLSESIVIVAGVFVFFNGLYFFNIIPPVPIALKDIGVYHYVVKDSEDSYSATFEPAPWWEFWKSTSSVYTLPANGTAYCFSSVFAPTGLSTPISHRWERYDANAKEWITVAEVEFPINGGRDQGYRGFSQKNSITPGKWRCDVETSRDQLVGRFDFEVVVGSTTPTLESATL